MDQTEDTIETPALGRPFQLGMLYDCRKDALIPGVTLWDYSSLQKDLTIKPQPKTESEIIASDSIDDKSSALDISASLKESQVLCCAMCLEMVESIRGAEWRILLLGQYRHGKSATGNTILGSKFFEFGFLCKSIPLTCQKEAAVLKGRKVVVVDTPGFFPTDRADEDITAKVRNCVKFCFPGSHVILHVIYPLPRTQEVMNGTQRIREALGPKAKDYTILLFTYKDRLEGQALENAISSRDEKLKEYIAECENRYLFFNNKAEGEEQEAQVAELMTLIDDLVEKNRDAPCYTEDMMPSTKNTTSDCFPFHQRPERLSN